MTADGGEMAQTPNWGTFVATMARTIASSRVLERQEEPARCDSLPQPSSCCRCRHGIVHVMPLYWTEIVHGLPGRAGDEPLRIPRIVNRATVMCGHPTALIPGLLDEYRLVQSICRHTLEDGEELGDHAERCGTCSGCEISCRHYEGPVAWEGWEASH